MNTKLMFSSNTDQWATPQSFYDNLNAEFNFVLDSAADKDNFKHPRYIDSNIDALSVSWRGYAAHGWIWCNPPYGRALGLWVKKAYETRGVVMLIPARTDTKYFHKYIYNMPDTEIRFIKGRLKFGSAKNSAPFPSMLVIFK